MYTGKFRIPTNRFCFKCHHRIFHSDVKGYPYMCPHCDENMYRLSAVWNPVYPIHMPPLQILYGKICTKKGEKKMKCPFLESEDCETCGYYDYVPEKKCYNCLHPFLNADDEKQQDWKKIVSYMRECGYEWSYEHMKHDYQTYYLHNLYCAFSLMDIIANRTVQCMRLFEENVPLEEITRFSEPQVAHMD